MQRTMKDDKGILHLRWAKFTCLVLFVLPHLRVLLHHLHLFPGVNSEKLV